MEEIGASSDKEVSLELCYKWKNYSIFFPNKMASLRFGSNLFGNDGKCLWIARKPASIIKHPAIVSRVWISDLGEHTPLSSRSGWLIPVSHIQYLGIAKPLDFRTAWLPGLFPLPVTHMELAQGRIHGGLRLATPKAGPLDIYPAHNLNQGFQRRRKEDAFMASLFWTGCLIHLLGHF